MIVWKGDIWLGLPAKTVDAICVTTNGIVKRNGALVMGAGIAKQARDRFDDIDYDAGHLVKKNGNHVQVIHSDKVHKTDILALPTKEHWRDPSPIQLILRSIRELVKLADEKQYRKVLLTPPGCGHGGLNWSDVSQVIEPMLDDRFIVCMQ